MATNFLTPFAMGEGANLPSETVWDSDTDRTHGFETGVANSRRLNRALAQGASAGHAIGAFISATLPEDVTINATTLADQFQRALKKLLLDSVYPVGSIFCSVSSTSPEAILGGTWEQIAGRFLLGCDSSTAAGTTGGASTATLITANLPSHNHTITVASKDIGSHTHTASTASSGGHTHTATCASAGDHKHTATTASAGAHTHDATTDSKGAHSHTRGTMDIKGSLAEGGNASTWTPSGCFVARTTTGAPGPSSTSSSKTTLDFQASKNWSGSTNSTGAHTHSLTTESAGAHTHTLTTSELGAHTHTVTTKTAGSHSHDVTVDSKALGTHNHTATCGGTGSGTAFSIVPPYFAVYMWRRTA